MATVNTSDNRYGVAQLIVAPTIAEGANFTTIASALAAATSGQTIFVRPGSYTENLTLVAGVNIVAFTGDQATPNVTIIGKLTMTTAGTVSISNIKLQTNSDFILAVTGSAASIVNLINCNLNISNNTGISFTTSSSSASINLNNCSGNLGTTGIAVFAHSSAGTLSFFNTGIGNTGASTTANTASAGTTIINYGSVLTNPTTTSSTAAFSGIYASFDTTAQNVTVLTMGGSGAQAFDECLIQSGSASAISISTSCFVRNCEIVSTNTNVTTGAGTITYNHFNTNIATSNFNTTTKVGTANFLGSISFDAGANKLSTFTEGTFVPTLRGSGTAGTPAMDFSVGAYSRIGNTVWFQINIGWNTAGGATGNWQITNLPFTIRNTTHLSPFFTTFYGTETNALATGANVNPGSSGTINTTTLNLITYNETTGVNSALTTATTIGSAAIEGFYFI